MSKLRVGFTLDISNPKYIYVKNVDEAVIAIKAIKETVALVSQKAEFVQGSFIINLEQFDETDKVWVFWFDESGRDINEYIEHVEA